MEVLKLQPKFNIWQLFDLLEKFEAGLLEADINPDDIFEMTQEKIDAIHEVIQAYDAKIDSTKSRIDQLRAAAGVLESKKKRLQEWLIKSCKHHGIKKFTSDNNVMTLVERKDVNIKHPANMETYIRFPTYVEMIEREPEFKWKKDDLKTAINSDDELREFAEEKTISFLKWSVPTDIVKGKK